MFHRPTAVQIRNAPRIIDNVVTYDTLVRVDNSDLLLKPGMTAEVFIITRLMQFLVEAVFLSVLGGLLGIALGAFTAHLVNLYGFPAVLSQTAMLVAFSLSAAIGIAFGFFPALKASRLDPIDALRHE